MFDEVYEFGAGETITKQYRLVVANGGWGAGQVEAVAGAWVREGTEVDEALESSAMPL